MEKELKILGESILQSKYDIAKRIHEIRQAEFPEEIMQNIPPVRMNLETLEKDIINIRANFVGLFGGFLSTGFDQDTAFDAIEKWAKETSQYLFNLGIPLDEALKDTGLYRSLINECVEETVVSHDMSVKTVFSSFKVLDSLLDHAVYCFSLTYVHFYTDALENAKKAFIELSVPVVPLSKGIAVLPLVGSIDTERAALLMEKTLKEAGRLNLSHLILDLSGVAIVDTMVAHQIFGVMDALKLLGVKTIITGIRPEIAQTVVSLGLDFSNQVTKANLQQAITDVKLFK